MSEPPPYGEVPATDADSHPVQLDPAAVVAAFEHARPATVSEAGATPGALVLMQATAVPGPSGPLRAPLSGVECVWYRSVVFRKERPRRFQGSRDFQPLPDIAPSDVPRYRIADMHAGVSRAPLGSDRTSTPGFGLSDGRSVIAVDPSVTDIDSTHFGINRLVTVMPEQRSLGPVPLGHGVLSPRELHVEWVLPVGAPVLAIGAVGRDAAGRAALVPGPGPALVSTKDRNRILSRNRTAMSPGLPFTGQSVKWIVGGVMTVAIVVIVLIVYFTVVR